VTYTTPVVSATVGNSWCGTCHIRCLSEIYRAWLHAKNDHVTQTTHLLGDFFYSWGGTCRIVDPLAKFKQRSFTHSKNIDGVYNFKKGHVTHTHPFEGTFFTPGVGLALVNPLAIFNERSFIHSRNIEGVLNL